MFVTSYVFQSFRSYRNYEVANKSNIYLKGTFGILHIYYSVRK